MWLALPIFLPFELLFQLFELLGGAGHIINLLTIFLKDYSSITITLITSL